MPERKSLLYRSQDAAPRKIRRLDSQERKCSVSSMGWEVQPFTGEKYKNAPSCSVFPVRLFEKRDFLLQFAENGYII